MKKKENENKTDVTKKNSIMKVFFVSLGKSLLSICVLILVGFISYKISYYALSKGTKTAPSKKEEIQEILKAAKTEEISKNLIYVCNDKDQITHMMLEICNTKTNNMDYITIPTKNDYTIPTTMYRKLCTMNEEIPQIVRISRMKQYFEEEQDAYGYGLLVIEKMLGTSISYYTVIDEETYANHYQEVKVKLSFKESAAADATPTPSPQATGESTPKKSKVSMKISIASDTYVKQLQDIQGDEDKIVDYIKVQYDRVQSNLSKDNKLGYIKSYEQMDVSLYHYWGIPGKYEGKVFQVDTKAAKSFLKRLINNETPYTAPQDLTVTQKATATATPAPTTAASKKKAKKTKTKKKVSSKGKRILILNGSKIAGLAGKAQKKLQEEGYTVPKVGDYTKETLTKTKIIVKEEGQGADLKKFFKNPTVTVGIVDDGYDIQIILGTIDANE